MIKTIPLYHLELVRDRSVPFTSLIKVEQCAEILHELLDRSPVEQLIVMYMDPQLNLVGVEKIGLGSILGVSVTMADIFRGAITASVPSIVLGHNHPCDDPTPSPEDWDLTDRAMRVGEQLGIKILDHIIVTPTGKHVSMKDEDFKQQDKIIGKVMDVVANLPPEQKKQMEDRLRKFGIDPNNILRGDGKVDPSNQIYNDIPNESSLNDLMKYRLDKLNNSKKN